MCVAVAMRGEEKGREEEEKRGEKRRGEKRKRREEERREQECLLPLLLLSVGRTQVPMLCFC